MIVRSLIFVFIASGLIAQQPSPDPPDTPPDTQATPPPATKSEGPKSPQWAALSVADKLHYDWVHLFEVDNFVYAAIGASFDQLRDRPPEWGQGGEALGERFASHVGQYIIQRSIMFPVQAIDHEDTRYWPSRHTSFGGRVGDAILHTVWRHDDSGGMMPAYSEFLGDYGAAAVSRMWWPDRYHTGSAIFIAGTDTILVDAGINVLHEFAPDIKKMLHFRR
jgi:hypothetical protein